METNEQRLKKIGDKLRRLRTEKGYGSYEFFAWEYKIPKVQYLNMENGRNYTMNSLFRVLNVHGVTLQEFFSDIE